jgi:hypothetical protein
MDCYGKECIKFSNLKSDFWFKPCVSEILPALQQITHHKSKTSLVSDIDQVNLRTHRQET